MTVRKPRQPETAADLLDAAAVVVGQREGQHGGKSANHAAIAAVWNGILEARAINGHGSLALQGSDVANLMEGLKIARRYSGGFNADDYLDGAGYAACAYEVRKGEVES
jgi:hypothetical protein